ncbi:hypothetical protein GWD52_11265 [Enterobacteriaceae bacterium 4M9]|nr:hypothetical protein [Enterobacteriaceae bacterium 4M9]
MSIVTEPIHERYFGFYSLHLPDIFKISPSSIVWLNDSVLDTIESRHQYRPAFLQFIERREKELKDTHPVDSKDAPYLKATYPLYGNTEGIMFERMENIAIHDVARVLEAYQWDKNATFKVTFKARDTRAARYDSVRETSKYVYMTDIDEKKNEVNKLLAGISFREDYQQPEDGRFAFAYGQVNASLLGIHRLAIRYNDSKGVIFTIETTNESEVIEDVLTQDDDVMKGENGATIYKKTQRIDGITYSEWLVKSRENKDGLPYETYNFTITTQNNDCKAHDLTMQYSTVDEMPENEMSEAELLLLWQQVISTLKYHGTPMNGKVSG